MSMSSGAEELTYPTPVGIMGTDDGQGWSNLMTAS